jgi:hypothetical protein
MQVTSSAASVTLGHRAAFWADVPLTTEDFIFS